MCSASRPGCGSDGACRWTRAGRWGLAPTRHSPKSIFDSSGWSLKPVGVLAYWAAPNEAPFWPEKFNLSLPDYEGIQQCLGREPGAAAEAHGTLCGLLCIASDDLPASWIHNTLADEEGDVAVVDSTAAAALGDLFDATHEALSGDALAFMPFLPEDATGITLRAEAIGRWCHGFLYGMAVRGLKEFADQPDEVREILEDFSQISRAAHDSGDDDEQAEAALVELVEYSRVGVQLIFDLLNPPAKSGAMETQ
jgi:uncharacterized protein YgfB (UPF0149 family)